MLWKKESNKPNALYMDIFAACKYVSDFNAAMNDTFLSKEIKPHPQKDDAIALQTRNDGNAAFRRKAYSVAMELYNDSLRFAMPNSEHISLAYANRSTCFLKLQMFEKCLKDIELAKEAGYPEHLMSKLEQRNAECLDQLKNGTKSETSIGTKLSFEAHKDFPSMANVLKFQPTDNSGNLMIASKDIDVGQTIVAEDVMFPFLKKRFGLKCNICVKDNENLVPCKKCAVAMFCPGCQGHVLHEYECGLNFCGEGGVNNDVMCRVRSILWTIKMFPTVDELMTFIEQIQKDKRLPTNLSDIQSKYRVYFNSELRQNIFSTDIGMMALNIYPTYCTVLKVPEIEAMFQSRKHLRFLVHLIGHTQMIQKEVLKIRTVNRGTIQMVGNPNVVRYTSCEDEEGSPVDEFNPMMKYFEHSCYPNVLRIHTNGQIVMITTRPIKNGEQVFKSSIPIDVEPNHMRQGCECSRCKGVIARPEQRQQFSSEPAFVELLEKRSNSDKSRTSDEIDAEIKTCTILLQKYGHIEFCEEIKIVLSAYHKCLYSRVIGNFN